MEQIKRGLRLFAEFFKIGCFTFGGGWAIVAQMEQEYVNRQKLITKDELLELRAFRRHLHRARNRESGDDHTVDRGCILQFPEG